MFIFSLTTSSHLSHNELVLYYWVYFALAPLALGGCVCAFLTPRLKEALKVHFWLRGFNCLVMVLLLTDIGLTVSPWHTLSVFLLGVEFILVGLVALSWFQFCLEYTGHSLLPRWSQFLLVLPPMVAGLLAWSSPELVWQGIRFYRQAWFLAFHIDQYGPVGIAGLLPIYLLDLVGLVLLVRYTFLSHRIFKLQTTWLGIGVLLPLVVNCVYGLSLLPGCEVGYSIEAMAIGGFCFAVSCRYYHLDTVKPVSRQAVQNQFPTGMIITDLAGNVADLNTTACRLLGVPGKEIFGKPIEAILKRVPEEYAVRRHPITDPEGQVAAWHLEIYERLRESGSPPSGSVLLSASERRVTELLTSNLSNKEISAKLNISANTVKFHLRNSFRKTGTANRSALIQWIADSGKSPFYQNETLS